MDFIQVAKELAAGGFATFLLVVLITGKYGIWLWGYHYAEMVREKDELYNRMAKEKDALIEYERRQKDEWRSLVWETHKLTEKSVSLVQKAVTQ